MPAGMLVVVGGWVLSPIIKELIGEVKSLVSSKYTSFKHFAKHVDQLVRVLEQIRTTVEVVQQGHRTDDVSYGGMVSWVGRIVDAIHEVESVLGAFAYDDIHMSNLRDNNNKVAQVAHVAARAGRRLVGRDKAFNRLKKLLEELPVIQQSLRDLAQLPQIHAGSSRSLSRPATGPLQSAATARELFVGYEHEYDRLVSALLNNVSDQPSSSRSNNNVVAVIGHSRTGKTTIARRAWHDTSVNRDKYFDLMVWASVPYMFSKTDLLTEIWRSLPGSSPVDEKCAVADMSFSKLQQVVHGLVGSRRYLLVLDDVCNDESGGYDGREKMETTWEDVLAPFRDGGPGSRILVTSRADICARTLGAGTRITLNGIGASDLILVLKKAAFGDAHRRTPHLDDVIKSVAEKLRGSPSAAKDFGDKLRNKHKKKHWKKLLETAGSSVHCGAGAGAGEITLAGVSSYRNLPPHLQSCLAFCSIFPDKWEFEPETLVKMWIAHGIISDSGHTSMEDVGRGYVRELQARSMLKSTSKRDGRATCFVIHEQVHSMLLSVSATYFFRLRSDGPNSNRRHSIPASVRHLSLAGGGCLEALAQLKDDPVLKKLRTLLVFDDDANSSSSSNTAAAVIDNHVLKQLKAVIVLDFAGTRIAELPKGVGKLKNLRYLGLPSSVRSLPATVTKLLHLQTLSLGKDCKLEDHHGFPADGMRNLINLRHLDMDMKYIAMIRGIGRLGKLQGSVEFCADRGKGHGMEELAGIDALHGALIVKGLQAVAGKEEAQKAQLGKKESLEALKLEWQPPKLGQRACSSSTSSQGEVLEGLQPHCNIQELHIVRYQGTSSPSWLESSDMLTSLSHLYLINCRNWPTLPCLSGLPDLRVLHIKEMYSVARIDHSLYGGGRGCALRSLEKLLLDDMPNLVEWSAESTDDAFPCLREILILNCPKLAKLPRVPSTVRNMRIENDDSYYLGMSFSSKSNSFTLDVHGEAVRLLHQDFLHRDHAVAISALSIQKYAGGENELNVNLLSSVRSLSLRRCVVTDRQLGVFFQNLPFLERLQISHCSEFRVFPEGAMPTSLKSIELKGCDPTLVEKLRGSARICSIALVHND
uniref:Uncharacterized protein n=1 Tax=Avena sativa TaxID=4498 RepID=A0ACD5Z0K4_AVESA